MNDTRQTEESKLALTWRGQPIEVVLRDGDNAPVRIPGETARRGGYGIAIWAPSTERPCRDPALWIADCCVRDLEGRGATPPG